MLAVELCYDYVLKPFTNDRYFNFQRHDKFPKTFNISSSWGSFSDIALLRNLVLLSDDTVCPESSDPPEKILYIFASENEI